MTLTTLKITLKQTNKQTNKQTKKKKKKKKREMEVIVATCNTYIDTYQEKRLFIAFENVGLVRL